MLLSSNVHEKTLRIRVNAHTTVHTMPVGTSSGYIVGAQYEKLSFTTLLYLRDACQLAYVYECPSKFTNTEYQVQNTPRLSTLCEHSS